MKKYILSGLLGLAISIGCLLPPILHFITGPLGPIIGGFVGGMRAKANWVGALIIGLTMGIGLSLLLIVVGSIIASFQISLPDLLHKLTGSNSLEMTDLLKYAMIPFSIALVLGTLGAFVGGKVGIKAQE